MRLRRAEIRGLGWPSAPQRALLSVLVSPAPQARRAWSEAEACLDIDAWDTGSLRLLPMVLRRLEQLGLERPDAPKLRGFVRHTWAKNQLQVRAGLDAAGALLSAGIPVCALKGLHLLGGCFDRDFSLRPMFDVDLLVPSHATGDALAMLCSLGWVPERPLTRRTLSATYLGTRHACELRRGPHSLDLHWHVLHQDLSPFFDRGAWRYLEPFQARGVPHGLSVLSATDQLIQLCLHGIRSDSRANRAFGLDATRLLEQGERVIDWERLLETVAERRLSVALEDALLFLAALGARVPPRVLQRLAAIPVFSVELFEYRAITRGVQGNDPLDRQALAAMHQLRQEYERITDDVVRSVLVRDASLRATGLEPVVPDHALAAATNGGE